MTELQQVLDKYLAADLRYLIISGARKKEGATQIRVRPLKLRGELQFQAALLVGKQEFHENHPKASMRDKIIQWLMEGFRQLQAQSEEGELLVLVSKKGKVTIKDKKKMRGAGRVNGQVSAAFSEEALSHNRRKRYILEEGKPVGFLLDLGVMTKEGKIVHARYDKFRQINRFLEFIEDILPQLSRDREVTIVDFGCGKSYLTFAMYYYLHELKEYDVRIIGLDLKEDVIAHCQGLARKYHYEKLHFVKGDIASYEGVSQVDMVVTLHACDTATDFALEKAVQWGAAVILSVPCCQHEINRQIKNETMAPVLEYGVIKERMAALMTDGLRAQVLEYCGYRTQILEFIDMEHTPKNLLIRAVYTGKRKENDQKLRECLEAFSLHPTLYRLLVEGGKEQ